MKRHDYELLTEVLQDRIGDNNAMYIATKSEADAIRYFEGVAIAERLAEALAQDNKAFDKERFINEVMGEV